MVRITPIPVLSLAVAGQVTHATSTSSQCTAKSLAAALPDNAEILSATYVPEGTSFGEGAADIAYPTNPTNLPASCAVMVNVTTSDSSFFRFGLFMPTTTWNQRYITVGTGGFAGGINWLDMGARVQYGFAVAGTDTGHNSTSGDVSWALDQPEKQLDFGVRAIHGTTVLAKKLVEQFYASEIAYSYYSGCSTGGRQGVRAVQYATDDFDGILVGAPAWWTARLQTWTTWMGKQNLPNDASNPYHIDPSLFPVIASEVQAQCDSVDGLEDGIISAPNLCAFNSSALLCPDSGNSTACLTAAQIETVNKAHDDYYINNGTKFGFVGFELGSEPGWTTLLSGDRPNPLGEQYVQYMLLGDPSWSYVNFTDEIVTLADKINPGNSSATDFAAMGTYKDNGGKVLLYHGMSDPAIPTRSSKVLYDSVANVTGSEDMDDWFRFFLVPGMGHCSGTTVDAPWFIAGANQAGKLVNGTGVYSVPGFADPQHDALLALMEWVEKGTPVDTIVATTWKNSTDSSSDVLRQRPLCRYPQRAVYDGTGDVDVAESWGCQ